MRVFCTGPLVTRSNFTIKLLTCNYYNRLLMHLNRGKLLEENRWPIITTIVGLAAVERIFPDVICCGKLDMMSCSNQCNKKIHKCKRRHSKWKHKSSREIGLRPHLSTLFRVYFTWSHGTQYPATKIQCMTSSKVTLVTEHCVPWLHVK